MWDWWEDVPHHHTSPHHWSHWSSRLQLDLGGRSPMKIHAMGSPQVIIQGCTESYRDPCRVHRLHTKEHDNSHSKNGD